MGKHRRHWFQMSASDGGETFRGSGPEQQRKLADPGSHATVEPDREAESELSEREASARRAVHTDREATDDFHLAAEHAGQRLSRPPSDADAESDRDLDRNHSLDTADRS